MGIGKFRVIILKAPSEENEEHDPYVQQLTCSGMTTIMIPSLEFRFKNFDVLSDRLKHPAEFGGLIVNSPRCARAIIQSIKTIDEELLTKWKELKCFVVGDATGRLLSDSLKFSFEGNDCGNLSNLLQFISATTGSSEMPFLMPIGNLHKHQKCDLKIEKVEVYETIEHPHLKENLCSILESDDIPTLISFFSPSGVKFALPYINQYPEKLVKFIAIGSSSARELKNCNVDVGGICAKPSPESLVETIRKIVN